MELALRLLQSRALALEGGPLLLELSFRLLGHAPLLAELLLHCGERRGLLLQGSTQLLSLLGLRSAGVYQVRAPSRVVRSCWS
jgi:hypothetical protein